jgi:leucyl-tRNA synthetase
MVCHESYRDEQGKWLYPAEVERRESGALHVKTGRPVTVGRSESMSKSKRNVVEPGGIIANYGADTARWFMLSDSPPERDLEWTEAGIEGAWRFTQRLWRLVDSALPLLPPARAARPESLADDAVALRRASHKAIAGVTDDIERFRFNRAVARLYELTNAIADASRERAGANRDDGFAWALREALESLTRLIGPMMPHFGEEVWQRLGHAAMLVDTPWPEFDPALVVDATVTMAVQVNGKLRSTVDLPRDADKGEAETAALADPKVQRAMGGKPVRKIVIVPNRIINVIA